MTSDYGLDSHSREQEEMERERCRGGFWGADAPEPALGAAAGPECWMCVHCTQAVWSTCSTAGWTCFSPEPSISSESST